MASDEKTRSHAPPVRTLLFSTLYPSSVRPGHGIFVETRLRELLKSGRVQTQVVAPVPWFPLTHDRFGSYAKFARTPRVERWNDVPVHHPRYVLLPKVGMTSAPLALALAALPTLRRLIREGFDFDLIDAHYYYPDGVAAALLGRWLRKPVLVTARGSDLSQIAGYALPRRMIRWAAHEVQASIGVCAALVDVLKDMGVPADRLHVMRNGVDLELFRPQPRDEARQALGLQGDPVIISVGNLIELKGNHLTLAALPQILARHPRAQFVMVGAGAERDALARQAQALGVASQVRFAGRVPQRDLATWFSAADVSVLASSREGWANVLLESMACGTPVVATRVWGTPEVVTQPCAGELVPERTPAAIAEAVLGLLARQPTRAAVRTYAEGFSWAATTQAQLDLFEQTLQPGRLPERVAHA